jgi:hypothetical protein
MIAGLPPDSTEDQAPEGFLTVKWNEDDSRIIYESIPWFSGQDGSYW